MGKIKDALLYGGLTRKQYKHISEDINSYNRNMLFLCSLFGSVVSIILVLVTLVPGVQLAENRRIYIVITIILLSIALITKLFAKRFPAVLEVERIGFMLVLFAIGILLAYRGADTLSATFIVFLYAIPMILVQRPIYIAFSIIIAVIGDLVMLKGVQDPVLFNKNMVNALCFGAASIMNGTIMSVMRVQKHRTDYLNRKLMKTDMMTDFLNRMAYAEIVEKYKEKNPENDFVYIQMDVNGLKEVNDSYGHPAGDNLIISVAGCIQTAFGKYGKLFRMGGDEFVALIHVSTDQLTASMDVLESEMKKKSQIGAYKLSMATGYAVQNADKPMSLNEMALAADKMMYSKKREYYEQNGIDRRKKSYE